MSSPQPPSIKRRRQEMIERYVAEQAALKRVARQTVDHLPVDLQQEVLARTDITGINVRARRLFDEAE